MADEGKQPDRARGSMGGVSSPHRDSDPGLQHKRIALGVIWVGLFVGLGKLAGAGKEMAVAWRYGVGPTIDAYVFLLALVGFPTAVWIGVLTSVVVPLRIEYRQQRESEWRLFRAELLFVALVLAGGTLLLGALGLSSLLHSGLSGLAPDAASAACSMIPAIVWLLPLGVFVGLFSVWTLACGRHRNTLLESVPALAILIAMLVVERGDALPLVWGTVAGYGAQLVLLLFYLIREQEVSWPRISFRSCAWPRFSRGILLVSAGQLLLGLTVVVDQFFAASIGTGAISRIGFSSRIVALVLGVGAVAANRATLPVFSEAVARGDSIKAIAKRWTIAMFVLGIVVSLAIAIGSDSLVRIIYLRGEFTSSEALQVASILRAFLWQVPFYFAGLVMTSALSSYTHYGVMLVTGMVGIALKPALNWVFIPAFGAEGIAYSSAFVYLATSSYMFWRLNMK